jgi:hypothetical protein
MKKLKLLPVLLMALSIVWISCEKEHIEIKEDAQEGTVVFSERVTFNKSEDILIAQFDGKPDADDIHSVAALGCMLRHPDLSGVNCFAVQGAYGNQGGKFIEASSLYDKVFGEENSKWTDANQDKTASATRVKDKVRAVLDANGKVWVQEAGQSNFTKLWISGLISDGVSESKIKSNVIVVQHSKWNEDHTDASDLSYVKKKTTYQPIDDGNTNSGSGTNRGPNTPNYKSSITSYLTNALKPKNPNAKARDYWKTADKIIDDSGFNASYSPIPDGGVDFSDCVESFYIFQTSKASSVSAFWSRYVTNNP